MALASRGIQHTGQMLYAVSHMIGVWCRYLDCSVPCLLYVQLVCAAAVLSKHTALLFGCGLVSNCAYIYDPKRLLLLTVVDAVVAAFWWSTLRLR